MKIYRNKVRPEIVPWLPSAKPIDFKKMQEAPEFISIDPQTGPMELKE